MLQQKSADTPKEATKLYTLRTATKWRPSDRQDSPFIVNVRKFFGMNPYRGAIIDYAPTAPAKDVSVAIIDVTGKKVREDRSVGATVGMHQLEWNLNTLGGGGGRFGGVADAGDVFDAVMAWMLQPGAEDTIRKRQASIVADAE
jgi:hypothetical protein